MEVGIQIIFTRTAGIIAAIIISFPLMYRSAKAAFEQIDPNLIHAGRTLGISEKKIFFRIVLPLALPGVASGAVNGYAGMQFAIYSALRTIEDAKLETGVWKGERKEALDTCVNKKSYFTLHIGIPNFRPRLCM
jgi:ABC-type Fe3+ transport system permease subunit